MDSNGTHRSGFVNIVGNPNVGKSTLINALIGENIAIVTSKVQTTRHRILGILNGIDFQIVYSDTPGILDPKYALQKRMMKYAYSALHDADLFLWLVDINDDIIDTDLYSKLKRTEIPILLLLNKIDTLKVSGDLEKKVAEWGSKVEVENILAISALQKINIQKVNEYVLARMPVHPPYYDKDMITDRPERFFVTEIVREKILLNYHQEIPYCVEVCVEKFIETEDLIKISTTIYVERQSQKGILIGKDASAIKKVSTEARIDMEKFFNKKIFLEQYVKVAEDWRTKDSSLDQFGYQ